MAVGVGLRAGQLEEGDGSPAAKYRDLEVVDEQVNGRTEASGLLGDDEEPDARSRNVLGRGVVRIVQPGMFRIFKSTNLETPLASLKPTCN